MLKRQAPQLHSVSNMTLRVRKPASRVFLVARFSPLAPTLDSPDPVAEPGTSLPHSLLFMLFAESYELLIRSRACISGAQSAFRAIR